MLCYTSLGRVTSLEAYVKKRLPMKISLHFSSLLLLRRGNITYHEIERIVMVGHEFDAVLKDFKEFDGKFGCKVFCQETFKDALEKLDSCSTQSFESSGLDATLCCLLDGLRNYLACVACKEGEMKIPWIELNSLFEKARKRVISKQEKERETHEISAEKLLDELSKLEARASIYQQHFVQTISSDKNKAKAVENWIANKKKNSKPTGDEDHNEESLCNERFNLEECLESMSNDELVEMLADVHRPDLVQTRNEAEEICFEEKQEGANGISLDRKPQDHDDGDDTEGKRSSNRPSWWFPSPESSKDFSTLNEVSGKLVLKEGWTRTDTLSLVDEHRNAFDQTEPSQLTNDEILIVMGQANFERDRAERQLRRSRIGYDVLAFKRRSRETTPGSSRDSIVSTTPSQEKEVISSDGTFQEFNVFQWLSKRKASKCSIIGSETSSQDKEGIPSDGTSQESIVSEYSPKPKASKYSVVSGTSSQNTESISSDGTIEESNVSQLLSKPKASKNSITNETSSQVSLSSNGKASLGTPPDSISPDLEQNTDITETESNGRKPSVDESSSGIGRIKEPKNTAPIGLNNETENRPTAILDSKMCLYDTEECGGREDEMTTSIMSGAAYLKKEEYDNAISYSKKYLDIAQECGDKEAEMNAYYTLGNAYLNTGRHSGAIFYGERCLAIAREHGNKLDEMNACVMLGITHLNKEEYDDAISYSKKCVDIAQECGDKATQIKAYGTLGAAYLKKEECDDAISYSKKCLDIAQECGDNVTEMNAYLTLGAAYLKKEEYDDAISYNKKYLAIAQECGDKVAEINVYLTLGDAYLMKEEYDDAISYSKKCLAIAQECGDKVAEINVYLTLGDAHLKKEEYDDAISYSKKCLAIAQECGDKVAEINAYLTLEDAHLNKEEYDDAISYSKKCLAIAKKCGDKVSEMNACVMLGITHLNKEEYDDAISYSKKCLAIAQECGHKVAEMNAYLMLGAAHLNKEEYDDAISYSKKCVDIAQECNDRVAEMNAYNTLGAAHLKKEEYNDAISYSKKCLDIAQECGHKVTDIAAYLTLNKAHLEKKEYDNAISYIRKYLDMAQECDNKVAEMAAYMMLGDAYSKKGEYDDAISNSKKCLDIAQECGHKVAEMNVYLTLGAGHLKKGEYDDAISNSKKCLDIAQECGHKVAEMNVYLMLEAAHLMKEEYDDAVSYSKKYLAIAQECGHKVAEMNAYLMLGAAHLKKEKYDDAISYSKKCLDIAHECGDKVAEMNAYLMLGAAHLKKEKYDDAISYSKKYLAIAQECGDKVAEMNAYLMLGAAHLKKEKYDDAISYSKKYLAIAQECGDKVAEINVYLTLGDAHLMKEEYDDAISYSKKCLDIAQERGDKVAEMNAHLMLGAAHLKKEEYDDAISYSKKCVDIALECGDKVAEMNAYNTLGAANLKKEEYDDAVLYSKKCLDIAQECGHKVTDIAAYYTLNKAHLEKKEYDNAISYIRKYLDMAQECGDKVAEMAAYMMLGDAYSKKGEYDDSISYSKKCLDIAQECGEKVPEMDAYKMLGNAYFNEQEYDDALLYSKKKFDIAQECGEKVAEMAAYRALWNYHSNKKEYDDAISYAEKCLHMAQQCGNKLVEMAAYKLLWDTHSKKEEYDVAISYGKKYVDIAQERGDKNAIMNAYYTLGYAHSNEEEYDDAISYSKKCLDIAQECGDKGLQMNVYLTLGDAHLKKEDYDDAISYSKKCLDIARECGDKVAEMNAYRTLGNALKENDLKYAMPTVVCQESVQPLPQWNEGEHLDMVDGRPKNQEIPAGDGELLEDNDNSRYIKFSRDCRIATTTKQNSGCDVNRDNRDIRGDFGTCKDDENMTPNGSLESAEVLNSNGTRTPRDMKTLEGNYGSDVCNGGKPSKERTRSFRKSSFSETRTGLFEQVESDGGEVRLKEGASVVSSRKLACDDVTSTSHYDTPRDVVTQLNEARLVDILVNHERDKSGNKSKFEIAATPHPKVGEILKTHEHEKSLDKECVTSPDNFQDSSKLGMNEECEAIGTTKEDFLASNENGETSSSFEKIRECLSLPCSLVSKNSIATKGHDALYTTERTRLKFSDESQNKIDETCRESLSVIKEIDDSQETASNRVWDLQGARPKIQHHESLIEERSDFIVSGIDSSFLARHSNDSSLKRSIYSRAVPDHGAFLSLPVISERESFHSLARTWPIGNEREVTLPSGPSLLGQPLRSSHDQQGKTNNTDNIVESTSTEESCSRGVKTRLLPSGEMGTNGNNLSVGQETSLGNSHPNEIQTIQCGDITASCKGFVNEQEGDQIAEQSFGPFDQIHASQFALISDSIYEDIPLHGSTNTQNSSSRSSMESFNTADSSLQSLEDKIEATCMTLSQMSESTLFNQELERQYPDDEHQTESENKTVLVAGNDQNMRLSRENEKMTERDKKVENGRDKELKGGIGPRLWESLFSLGGFWRAEGETREANSRNSLSQRSILDHESGVHAVNLAAPQATSTSSQRVSAKTYEALERERRKTVTQERQELRKKEDAENERRLQASREERERRPPSSPMPASLPVQESTEEGPCSHYKRKCKVRFPCCKQFYPCHRCHNNSDQCQEEDKKALDSTHLKCLSCSTEQEITKDSHHCKNCHIQLSEYFCGICKHFTGNEKNPYHCKHCGICRVHRDRSFHCEVCNVCLDNRLRNNHKCRPNSGHDECCICLEDAFGGCQILPCSHKVHRECAVAMLKNGVRKCPICRSPLYQQE